jgi:hypothetical protein
MDESMYESSRQTMKHVGSGGQKGRGRSQPFSTEGTLGIIWINSIPSNLYRIFFEWTIYIDWRTNFILI